MSFLVSSNRVQISIFIGFASVVLILSLVISFATVGRLLRQSRELSESLNLNLTSLSQTVKRNESAVYFDSQNFQKTLSQLQIQQTELNALQRQLSERAASAEFFSHHVINSLPSGLIAFDANGMIRIINEPAKTIFSLKVDDDFENSNFQQVFASSPPLIKLLSETLDHRSTFFRTELDMQTEKKRKRIGLTVAPLAINGEISGALCLVADITEINELREQIATQRNLDSLGMMSAGLAHEFKNALAALHGYAQFLSRTARDEKTNQAAKALTTELRGLSELVTSFLDFARPQSIVPVEVKLEQLIADTAAELKELSQARRVEIKIDGVFPILLADKTVLRQAIINLIRNAVEAFEESDEIAVRCVKIKGFCTSDESHRNWANIEIKDNGVGIAQENLADIFVPFYTTKPAGHGIGLALAHRIITQHGGTLYVSSSLREGTTFTVKLAA